MSLTIGDLEPSALWDNFRFLCSIPHPSHHETALSDALLSWAAARGIRCERDEEGNLVMRAPAAPGCEGRPGIVLQAHLDMVPQARAGSAHDFFKDPVRPGIDPADPDWVIADGTTLGADDGMGVAAAMAMLEDGSVKRGPLECLFTVNEEDGMSGARGLKPGLLSGKYLINLDGEDADEITIGCAGMLRVASEAAFKATVPPAGYAWLELGVSGLLGGHSGVDIHLGRANAIMAIARVLAACPAEGRLLAVLEGGGAANAIPREARAIVGVPAAGSHACRLAMKARMDALAGDFARADPGIAFSLSEAEPPAACLSAELTDQVLATLLTLPDGCLKMEPTMPDITRSSSNLGTIALGPEDGRMVLRSLALVRSSVEADKQRLGAGVEEAFAALGASSRRPSESPSWKPEPTSLILSLAVDEYRKAFGEAPKLLSTHAGLECGVFRPVYPDWEMISIGPTIKFPHSPDERVSVASVRKFWRFLTALVSRLR